jgi:hypothetical protein
MGMTTHEPTYLPSAVAAKRIGVTPGTLAKMRMRPGDGPPFVRLSRRKIVYATATIDQWLMQREFRSTKDYAPAAV